MKRTRSFDGHVSDQGIRHSPRPSRLEKVWLMFPVRFVTYVSDFFLDRDIT